MFERTENARKMIKQEKWTNVHAIRQDDTKPGDAKYLVLDWMDVHPGKWSDYVDMEEHYYMPVHQQRVDAGNIQAWALYGKMGYSELPGSVDAVTTASYDSYEAMWNSYPPDAWEEAHGGVDQGDVYERMRKTRLMTGSTILRLVEFQDPETAKLD